MEDKAWKPKKRGGGGGGDKKKEGETTTKKKQHEAGRTIKVQKLSNM